MASRRASQNLPHLVKGGTVVGACTYQSSQAARSYHDDEAEGYDHQDGVTALGGGGGGSSRDAAMTSTSPRGLSVKRVGGGLSPSSSAPSSESSSPEKRLITPKEVEDASRILFAPEDSNNAGTTTHRQARVSNTTAATAAVSTDSSSTSSAGGAASLIPPPVRGPNPSNLAPRLHPKPVINQEILRFGVALASNPKIQTVIREQMQLHKGLEQVTDAQGSGVEEVEVAMRRLCGFGDDEDGEGGSSGLMGGSFEVLGLSSVAGSTEAGEEEDDDKVNHMGMSSASSAAHCSNSFISLGRNIRRKDSLAGDVSEEVLDELLRSDDDDDAITQKMFAQTPDEQVRRFLRNLDLECVICHEFMVEATAIDCGHTFCGECIGQWLDDDRKKRCPTCQKAVSTRIPMRQYDTMIEKYIRASNLWDEITSYYRRKTLSRMRRELEEHEVEEGTNYFSCFGLSRRRRGSRNRRRSTTRTSGAGGGETEAAAGNEEDQEREETTEYWWKSEVLQTALSVATMLILVVLFRRVKA